MTTFALLHGGMHWGRCWDLVRMRLQVHGHTVVVPDLPIDDDGADASAWAKVATEAIDSCIGHDDPDVVVVAHSISGLCVPLIAEHRTVRRMVFLSALIPTPGKPFADCVPTAAVAKGGHHRHRDEGRPRGGAGLVEADGAATP